jgi:ubiquinone/menaquinone biosynthesis C-methylase UbiE
MVAFANPRAYELWMGRWSERLAPAFVDFAGLEPGGRYLDVGAGTGVLARAVVERFGDVEVVGIEPADSFVAHARDTHRNPRLRFQVGDAQAIGFADGRFDGALALLILQELSDAPLAVAEMARVTRRGGTAAACQWDFRDGFPLLSLFWAAAREVLPEKITREEAASRTQQGYSDADALAHLWTDAGLTQIETAPLEIQMDFASFDDYWRPFLSGVTPTSSYAPSLPEETRQALQTRLRQRLLGDGADRPFSLPARAWAVRGNVR